MEVHTTTEGWLACPEYRFSGNFDSYQCGGWPFILWMNKSFVTREHRKLSRKTQVTPACVCPTPSFPAPHLRYTSCKVCSSISALTHHLSRTFAFFGSLHLDGQLYFIAIAIAQLHSSKHMLDIGPLGSWGHSDCSDYHPWEARIRPDELGNAC